MKFQVPSFKAFIHPEAVSHTEIILFDEQNRRHLIEGKAYSLLAPYLSKGKHSIDDILEALKDQLSAAEIYYALFRLKEKGFLEEGTSNLSKPVQVACDLLNVSYADAKERLKKTRISLHLIGEEDVIPLQSMLNEMGVEVVDEGDFSIWIVDNYRKQEVRNALQKLNKPFLLIQPTRMEVLVGPLLTPDKGPCFDCFLHALNHNSIEEMLTEKDAQDALTIKSNASSSMSSFAYNLAANEAIKWVLKGENSDIESKILSYHFLRPEIVSHQVIKKSDCRTCGKSISLEQKPIVLESQKKGFTEDGGHRIHSPEETYKKYEHLISPITGIVDYLIPAHEDELTLIHTYEAGHRLSGTHLGHALMHKSARSHSAGKGRSAAQGKTSCLCEALERYSGIYQGNEQKKRSSYKGLVDALHPYDLLQFSDHQYQTRSQKNEEGSSFHYVPESFDEQEVIDWTPVWSLTNQCFKFIPTAMCYFSYPFKDESKRFCRGDSNGSAAGNTKEEAILQGFFELVERDQIALWWYSRLKRPEVDLASFSDPYIERLISVYAAMGRKMWVLDLTFDLEIPTFVALSCNEVGGEILFGFGSHFDPKIAVLRALTEMNQALLFLKRFSPRNPSDSKHKTIRDWVDNEQIHDHPYLVPSSDLKKMQDYKRLDTPDLKEDILMCQQIVEKKGMEMLVLDQTRVDIELPVVKVFVPGLRHFWNRYAPGRLYDVPFSTGLIDKKLTEDELNPIPFFL